jgi:hypothetical protein
MAPVAVMRRLTSLDQPFISRASAIVEPELDMRRTRPRSSAYDRMLTWVQKLFPIKAIEAGPPRRAIARELEEAWPTADR